MKCAYHKRKNIYKKIAVVVGDGEKWISETGPENCSAIDCHESGDKGGDKSEDLGITRVKMISTRFPQSFSPRSV